MSELRTAAEFKSALIRQSVKTNEQRERAEAAEASAAQLQAEAAQWKDAKELSDYHFNQSVAKIDALQADLKFTGDILAGLRMERDALAAELAAVKAERDALKLEAIQPWYNPALDEGDGVYRP